jgi:hypothetical protein
VNGAAVRALRWKLVGDKVHCCFVACHNAHYNGCASSKSSPIVPLSNDDRAYIRNVKPTSAQLLLYANQINLLFQ